jgi:hypothetical protein
METKWKGTEKGGGKKDGKAGSSKRLLKEDIRKRSVTEKRVEKGGKKDKKSGRQYPFIKGGYGKSK